MYLKFLSPIILEIKKKSNVNLFIYFNYSQSRDRGKWRDFPFLDSFNFENKESVNKRLFFNNLDLEKSLFDEKIDIVYSLLPHNKFNIEKKKLPNTKWYLVQHGIDLFWDIEDIVYCDLIYLYSDYWKSKVQNLLEEKKVKFDYNKIRVTGNPQFNIQINKSEVRKKYNIPKNKKILIFFPFSQPNAYPFENKFKSYFVKNFIIFPNTSNLLNSLKRQFYYLLGFFLTNEIQILTKIYEFCKKNDYFLIVKSRSKRVLNDDFKIISDLVLYDEQLYPSTIIELLSIAEQSIGFISTIPGEASFAECYNYSIFNSFFKKIENRYLKFFDIDYFDFNGVNEVIDVKSLFKNLNKNQLKKVNLSQNDLFLKKYFNYKSNNNFDWE